MPMSSVIPPDAAGFYVMIRPTVLWLSSAIEGDYKKVVAKIMRERPLPSNEMEKVAVQMVVRGIMGNVEYHELPLESQQRQEALWMAKFGASMLAALRREVFFAIIVGDDFLDDDTDFSVERVPAKSIQEAQKLIMARPDVQEIERRKVVDWSPTVRH